MSDWVPHILGPLKKCLKFWQRWPQRAHNYDVILVNNASSTVHQCRTRPFFLAWIIRTINLRVSMVQGLSIRTSIIFLNNFIPLTQNLVKKSGYSSTNSLNTRWLFVDFLLLFLIWSKRRRIEAGSFHGPRTPYVAPKSRAILLFVSDNSLIYIFQDTQANPEAITRPSTSF